MIFLTKKDKKPKERKKLSKKVKTVIFLSVILFFLAAFAAGLVISNYSLKVARYTQSSDRIQEPLRIALISDLHARSFGDNNKRLINKIKKESPDIICVAGDILSRDDTEEEDFEYLENLTKSLSDLAPTYISVGNHERTNPKFEQIKTSIKEQGGILLDNEYANITVKGNSIRIGGISFYRRWDENSKAFLQKFSATEDNVYTLLLCHHPEFYLWGIKEYPIDLTLSGHTHGGMVKVPFAGPLFSPEQGWFPDYAAGFYEFENGTLAVTSGLGSSPEYLPRFLNRPEIMIIELK